MQYDKYILRIVKSVLHAFHAVSSLQEHYIFIEQPNKKLFCALCNRVFKDPVIVSCGVSTQFLFTLIIILPAYQPKPSVVQTVFINKNEIIKKFSGDLKGRVLSLGWIKFLCQHLMSPQFTGDRLGIPPTPHSPV